ncbi:uncharacterized protein CIMG_08025 [Coccidioides immitis RS]|uniref:RNA recognition motif-containing protein n=1 Tax=Coccidioides immitis (strain RS) TaxID=246410 RepID=J3K4M7_COCIM|nr:uncharacterized protein CIMG_08025 [Coccidioides immitis RS]EAS29279.3 hypothetical protein CIMG_08025 [Coccidioides immitis RS]TPX22610.1 hypothetical protein DIZ76_014487 [Coccidioides immitis]
MPPLPGEERLLTVFADVHYYFSPPSPRPPLHRFDKGSYLYLYHDATQHKARIEIANNPGLPEQDAFAGSLGATLLRNSDKFPTLFTLTVNAQRQSVSGEQPGQLATNEWSLISGHPHDTSGTLHKLHTLDIYFWTVDDAGLFLATVRRILDPSQIDIIATQPSQQTSSMSTVVQQLEQAAISDPGYQNNYPGRTSPTSSTNLPPPPPGAPPVKSASTVAQPPTAQVSSSEEPEKQPQDQKAENYAPLAYNPAAPAAPEPIKHREKTPPPPDAATGTGLAAAAAREQGTHFTHLPGSSGSAMYTSPPPTAGLTQPQSPPPHSSGLSFGPTSGPVTTGPPASGPPAPLNYAQQPPSQEPNIGIYRQQSFGPPPGAENYSQAQQFQQQHAVAYSQPQTPPAIYGQHQAYQPQSQPHPQQPQVPISGYSDYSYGQPQQTMGNAYDIHNQVYRPTENEHRYHQRRGSGSLTSGDKKPGKITENAMRVEKGVNRFLKKLEKKL